LGIALAAAIIGMVVSGTAGKMTLAGSGYENTGDHHH
jgi:hypothetical protein